MTKIALERRDWILLGGGLAVTAAIWLALGQTNWMIIHPAVLTGYTLAAIALSLGLYGVRKRLPGLPIGKASTWLKLHVASGLVLLFAFWLHLGTFWPSGLFEQILALSFYIAIVSGLLGRVIQKTLPLAIASIGDQVILERIPRDIIGLRERVETCLIDCATETGELSLTVAYEETLAWYFRQPRFTWSTLVGMSRGRHWFRNQATILERTLSAKQLPYLEQIKALAARKHVLDRHYALQHMLKAWLFLHIPSATVFAIAAIWHIALVHIYAQ